MSKESEQTLLQRRYIDGKHTKRCSTSYVIKELQSKRTRYHYKPIRMAKFKTLTTPNAGKDMEQQEPSFIAGGDAMWYSHFRRQFGGFLQN